MTITLWSSLLMVASFAARGQGEPRFDSALREARRANKPLVIEFGSEGCEPCKVLRKELKESAGRSEVGGVHFVEWQIDQGDLDNVHERFRVRANPTLIAFGPDARELDRWLGFDGDIEPVIDWLRAVPHHLLPLAETVRQADEATTDAELQLIAGRRLMRAKQPKAAAVFLARAARASRPDIAAAALWEAGRSEGSRPSRTAAEEILVKYPRSRWALPALEIVAEAPRGRKALISEAIETQAHLNRNRKNQLDRLVWLALRAGLPDVAEDTLKLFHVLLPTHLQAMYAIDLNIARGETAEGTRSLMALDEFPRRRYPAVVRDLEARLLRRKREPPLEPLFTRINDDRDPAFAAAALRRRASEPSASPPPAAP